MSTCVEDMFLWVYQGGEGLAQGCLHVHGFMSYRTGPRTCSVPITEGNTTLSAGEKGGTRWYCLFRSVYTARTIEYTRLCSTWGASHGY